MSDWFLHKHQASLDSQREEAEINWLFPEDDEEEIEDKDFPYVDDEPSDYEMMSNFGTKWHDWKRSFNYLWEDYISSRISKKTIMYYAFGVNANS